MNSFVLSLYLQRFIAMEKAAIRIAQDRERIVPSPVSEVAYMEYPLWQAGAEYQKERIAHIARLAATDWPGDFVEIGSYLGETTVILAEIAREFGRKVIAVDPYETGTQNCAAEEYEFFLEQIAPFGEVVEHVRKRSDDAAVRERLDDMDIAFAFVDGLHTYQAALLDMQTVAHARVIAVDDMTMQPVRLAYLDCEAAHKVDVEFLREAYVLCTGVTDDSEL